MLKIQVCIFIFLWNIAVHGQGLYSFEALLAMDCLPEDSLDLKLLEAQSEYYRKDNGIQFLSTVGTNEFGDLDSGNALRIRAGLEWNILNEGWRDRKLTAQLYETERQIKQLKNAASGYEKNHIYKYNYIIYVFNIKKLTYLEERKYLLNLLINRYEALYHSNAIHYKDLLVLYEQAEEISITTYALQHYNAFFKEIYQDFPVLDPDYLPVLEVDIEGIMAFKGKDTSHQDLMELYKAQLELETKLDSRTRLSIYNNAYLRPGGLPGTDQVLYNNVGLRFSTDIQNRSREREKINKIRLEIAENKFSHNTFNSDKELMNYLLEYYGKMKEYVHSHYRLRAFNEEKRLDQAIKFVNTGTPHTDVKTLNIELERIKILNESLEVKQHMYLLLLQIYKLAQVPELSPFVHEKILEQATGKLTGDRLLRLSEEDLRNHEFSFIFEYLKKNDFSKIILQENSALSGSFLKELEMKGIVVYSSLEAISGYTIIEVPMKRFKDRVSMEYWIEDQYTSADQLFFVPGFQDLLIIDSFALSKE